MVTEDYEHFPPDAEANIAAFVQRIKEMAPRVTQIYMDFSERKGQLVTRYSSYVYYLFSELFKLAKVIVPSDTSYMRVCHLDFESACKLMRINSDVSEDTWSILKLARLNAHTLHNIHFWSNREVAIYGLIRDSNDDKYEEYPRLRTLEIDVARVSALLHRSTFEGAIPFPSLQRLVVNSSYPFGDDVVFRGNGRTLEYLKAALYPELVKLLRRYDIFTRTSHPKLKCVDTRLLSSRLPNPFATATAYLRFVFSIVSGASVHVIAAAHLSFWEAVTLIKSLPLLSDLCTGNPALGEIPQGATEADLPEYAVVDHIENGSRQTFDGLKNAYVERSTLPMPLLWVCRNLREAVLARYCNNYQLFIRSKEWVKSEFYSWPYGLQDPGPTAHHLVKYLTIVTDIHTVFSGCASKILCQAPYNGCPFPKARSLVCNVYWSPPPPQQAGQDHSAIYPPKTEANIRAFALQVKQMAPMVDDIVVYPCYVSDDLHPAAGHLFGYLIAQLNQLASCVKYTSSFSNIPMLQHSGSLDGLVHFTYKKRNATDGTHELLTQLVRRNAPTLQVLEIKLFRVRDVADLVRDSDSGYTEYPCLKTLKLNVWMNMDESPLSVADGVVLFPALRHLSILGDYPFDDDVLFRGNSAILEYLSIMPAHETCQIICEHKVFTPTSHPKLQCVKVEWLPDYMEYGFDLFVECLQFVLGIAPGASVRSIADLRDREWIPLTLNLLADHVLMQILYLPDTRLLLSDVIGLIKSLSLLSDLLCESTRLDVSDEGFASEEFAAQLNLLSDLKRERFRCWRLGHSERDSLEDTAMCVLTVALACPNFNHVALPKSVHTEFMTMLEETIEMDRFKQDTPRLRRLLFNREV
ncbi:hypothetical protein GGH93_001149 [Coemansia aciculifera]|nr:hypothetical protein GGH93_001149 [Coemansia aciculifera]